MSNQIPMFPEGDDLPLFSGNAAKAQAQVFNPRTEYRQEAFANCRFCLDTGVLGDHAFCWCEAGQQQQAHRQEVGPEPIEYVSQEDPCRIDHEGLTPIQSGRLKKALAKVFRFELGTMSLGAYLAQLPLTRKSAYTRHYAQKRRNLEYKKLDRPKIEYTAWYDRDGRELGTSIPKVVYDALNLPDSESGQYHN